jgi:hypothetical protein
MSISYDVFSGAFLSKVTEYDFPLDEDERNEIVDGFMKRAIASFKRICKYDLFTTNNDATREYDVEIATEDVDEIADIVSEGMVVQWLKPYVYKQENLANILNTRDFTSYSPAELLLRIGGTYTQAQTNFTQMMREYSYNHGDLTRLHL